MPRTKRKQSETDIYHVTIRGIGKRILFENDSDRERFLYYLSFQKDKRPFDIYAWCLMTNHVHLLFKTEYSDLTKTMHGLCTAYANYYNAAHQHVGPVFQQRFSSIPVESDAHLFAAIRYIHLNPIDIGADIETYPWSSYQEYFGHEGICETHPIMEAFESVAQFKAFHDEELGKDYLMDLSGYRMRIPDDKAISLAKERLGETFSESIPNMEKPLRDESIRRLYALGLSCRQIGRLTGIGAGIIQRAVAEMRKRSAF